MEEKIRCSVCGANLNEETAMEFEGNVYCDNCLSEKTVVCADCNERIWREDAEGDEELVLCRRCYDYNYTSCEDCGRLLHNDATYYDDDDSDGKIKTKQIVMMLYLLILQALFPATLYNMKQMIRGNFYELVWYIDVNIREMWIFLTKKMVCILQGLD